MGMRAHSPACTFTCSPAPVRPAARRRQDRKEKEREKRMKGQSSHREWKSEAEMLMRQQYDG